MKDKNISRILFLIIVFVMFCAGAAVFYYLVVTNPENESVEKTNNTIENSISNEVVELKEDEIDEEGKVYSVKKVNVYRDGVLNEDEYQTLTFYEYNDTHKGYAEILYMFTDYTTDPSFEYSFSIKDENDKEVLINDDLMLGPMIIAKIEKMELNQVLKFVVEERLIETQEVTKIVTAEINLQEDLEDIVEIDLLKDMEEVTLGHISLKYPKSDNARKWPVNHAYSTKLVGETFSTNLNVQYGNYLYPSENMNIRYENNVNDLTLEEAFESLSLINEKAGLYGLSDVYGLHITTDDGEIIDTILVSFDEMINLCNGLSIEKDGVTYTGKDFEFEDGRKFEKQETIKIAGEIDAIKYNDESETYDNYMFVYNGNLYELAISREERIEEEIQAIIDSIEIVK